MIKDYNNHTINVKVFNTKYNNFLIINEVYFVEITSVKKKKISLHMLKRLKLAHNFFTIVDLEIANRDIKVIGLETLYYRGNNKKIIYNNRRAIKGKLIQEYNISVSNEYYKAMTE